MLGRAVVAMVQPTQASARDDLTRACRTSPARRCLLLKPEVRSVVMIIGDVFKEESLHMVLVQSNDVVEQIPSAVPTQRSAIPFCHGHRMAVCEATIFMDRIEAGTSNPYFAS